MFRRLTTVRITCFLACCFGLAAAAPAQTVADARAAGVDAAVTLDDVTIVSLVDQVGSGTLASFQVEDATGGITVFGSNALIDPIIASLSVGDVVDIGGTTDEFAGLFEIVDDAMIAPLTVTDTGVDVSVTPTIISTADLVDMSTTGEGLESRLVRLNGCLLYTSPSPRDATLSRMPSSA